MGEEVGPLSTEQLIFAVFDGRVTEETEVRNANGVWTPAHRVDGLFAAVERLREKKQNERLQHESAVRERNERDRKRREYMTVSTCAPPLSQHFEIIDTVFAMDSRGQAGFLVNEEADPHGAFAGVKQKLKDIAFHLGADAVVNCQFEYRVAVSTDKLTAAVGAAEGV